MKQSTLGEFIKRLMVSNSDQIRIAKSAKAAEYTDRISAEDWDSPNAS